MSAKQKSNIGAGSTAATRTARGRAVSISFAPSCVITLDKNGTLAVQALNESADPALAMRDELRKTKGRDSRGNLLYSHVLPIIRGKSTRQLHFG